jgi:predicted nucleic acid-binding protein
LVFSANEHQSRSTLIFVFLELLLEQKESESVRALLSSKTPDELGISDLAFHSLGIILYQKNAAHLFSDLVRDLFGEGGIAIFALGSDDMVRLEQVATTFSLDFDDAYQYVVAEKFGLTLVSFDTDFDRTGLKRIIPSRIL